MLWGVTEVFSCTTWEDESLGGDLIMMPKGPHATFVRHGGTGQIKKYAEWAPQSNPRNPAPFELVKRFDLEGPAHTNADGTVVETPHINLPSGGDARAPQDWEKPIGCP
ncbi:hypothetical protein GCM10010234_04760 [Streptomyces hawaiiensis]